MPAKPSRSRVARSVETSSPKSTHSSEAQPGPTKLLHVSDLHAQRRWFDWVAREAERNNWAVAFTGDLLNIDHQADFAELRRQTKWITEWVRAARFPLFLCSGNHDLLPYEKDGAWLRALARPGATVDGQFATVAGYTLACLPWSSGVENFLHPEVLAADIWLHHAPPSESEIARAADGMDWGSGDLCSALSPAWQARVRLVLSGHVHSANTWYQKSGGALCLNAAPQDFSAAVPRHIVIDLPAGFAELRETTETLRVKLPRRQT